MDPAAEAVAATIAYHERTKHQLHRYARSPGYLDWATQPNPFRTYAGAPRVSLPLGAAELTTPYDALYAPGAVPVQPLDRGSLGIFFELSLGLTAWKQAGTSRWALRANPSSGNLHPTEGYAVVPSLAQIDAGLYHYLARDHTLERRATLTTEAAARLAALLPVGGFLVALSSIHWREAWKYGERAFRYCQHDTGHAIAALRYAAGALGWRALLCDGLGDERVSALLGLDREADFAEVEAADREHPDAALLIFPGSLEPDFNPTASGQASAAEEVVALIRAGVWSGRANALSPSHVEWEAIDIVARGTRRPAGAPPTACPRTPLSSQPGPRPSSRTPAATLILQRRSAVALDGRTSISAQTFYAMLDHLLPRSGVAPWDVLPWEPQIHAAIFVHRVEGLVPGLYLLERHPDARLRGALRGECLWQRPEGCPRELSLFLLQPMDCRETSQVVSCHQAIAADGAFSLGMLADFAASLAERGAWWYRRLFWEAGVLGQVLYLEAEAAGVRATGIGCYFDDAFHELLGLRDLSFQDLYHFTLGGPIEDQRLITLPAYG